MPLTEPLTGPLTEPLTDEEARALGCLLEKELATPQYYPLTLNALTLACNQTSNRDPVVEYGEDEVSTAIAGLREKGLARVVLSSGQRAGKYRQAITERLGLDEQHRALLAVLLLRGPQTVGELRQRTERLATFDRLDEVDEVLVLLARREDPLVLHLERAPGQKEARWMELLSGRPVVEFTEPRPRRSDEVAELREEVALLREEVAELRQQINDLLG